MAKTQTFTSKTQKGGEDDSTMSVKVIVASKTEKGSYRFNERVIKVKDLNEVEKVARES